jgi:hypothetical protein
MADEPELTAVRIEYLRDGEPLEPSAPPISDDAEAIAKWLEAGCLRPNDGYGRMDVETYLKVAKLIRDGWHRR